MPDARGGEVQRGGTAQATGADDEDPGGQEAFLAGLAQTGHEDVASIPFALFRSESHDQVPS
jgi:hypothetical protein